MVIQPYASLPLCSGTGPTTLSSITLGRVNQVGRPEALQTHALTSPLHSTHMAYGQDSLRDTTDPSNPMARIASGTTDPSNAYGQDSLRYHRPFQSYGQDSLRYHRSDPSNPMARIASGTTDPSNPMARIASGTTDPSTAYGQDSLRDTTDPSTAYGQDSLRPFQCRHRTQVLITTNC